MAEDDIQTRSDIETRADLIALMIIYHANTPVGNPDSGWPAPVLLLNRPATPELLAQLSRYPRLLYITAWHPILPTTALPNRIVPPTLYRTFPGLGLSIWVLEKPAPAIKP